MTKAYHIVFDGFPSPDGPRFIEVENDAGASISAGEWKSRDDGLTELVLPVAPPPTHISVGSEPVAWLSESTILRGKFWLADPIDHKSNSPHWTDAFPVYRHPAPAEHVVGLPQDVINLVIAAREFWEQAMDESDESAALDIALEAFSSRVPYENEPDAKLEDQP